MVLRTLPLQSMLKMSSSVITLLQMWDPESCECRCRPEEIKDCMTGYKYDGVFSCQCLPVPYSAGTPLLVVLGVMLVILVAAILIILGLTATIVTIKVDLTWELS